MIEQTQFVEHGMQIHLGYLPGISVIRSQHDDCSQSLDNMGITVDQHLKLAAALVASSEIPHLALASENLVILCAGRLGNGWRFAAKFDDIAVTVFPVFEK